MKTDRLVIRKFKKSDVDNLYQLLSGEDIMRYMEPPYSRERVFPFWMRWVYAILPLFWQ